MTVRKQESQSATGAAHWQQSKERESWGVGEGGRGESEVRFWGVVECVDVRWVRGGRRLHVRKGGEVRACVVEHFGEGAGRCKKKRTN